MKANEGRNVALLEDAWRDRCLLGLFLPIRRLLLPRLETYDCSDRGFARTSRFSSARTDDFRRQFDVGDSRA